MQNIYSKQHFLFQGRAVRVGLKLGKIGPKWDKSGTETDLKDSQICSILGQYYEPIRGEP